MKRNTLIFAVVAVIFAAIGAYAGLRHYTPETPKLGAVEKFFNLSMDNAKGQEQALSLWKGKVLVVNFWATWCAPCVKEMPDLSALQIEMASKNIQIIGIGIDTAANITEFSTKYKISYPLYVAGLSGTNLMREFGNQSGGLPYTLLIGSDGRVKKAYLGQLKMDGLRADLLGL